jgi:WD40 repeat protein
MRTRTSSLLVALLPFAASALAQGPPQIVWSRQAHTSAVEAVAYSPDGVGLASGADQPDTTAAVWRASNGALLEQLPPHDRGVRDVAFSPDGRRLAVGYLRFNGYTFEGRVNVWDLASATIVRVLVGGAEIAFSPDGSLLADDAGGPNHLVSVWRVADGSLVFRADHGAITTDVAWSPDGRFLASAGTDDTVKLWDVATGTLARTLVGHTDVVNAIAFSPDGSLIASGAGQAGVAGDASIKIWRTSDGALQETLAGHGDAVDSLAFSPDGATLVSSGRDPSPSIRFWSIATGAQTALYDSAVDGGIASVAYAPSGGTFAYGRGDGVLVVALAPDSSGSSSCTFSVAPTSGSVGRNGGTGTITVTTQDACAWTAASNAGWISVSPASGTGSGGVTVTVARNSTGRQRTGTLLVAGQTVTIVQRR